MSRTYVIGHVNPDSDSIASAMGYAWFLQESEAMEVTAARAGPINPQTTWLLKRLELDPPVLVTDASPRFDSVARRLDTALPDDPLRDAWSIASRTGGVAPIVDENGKPYGLVTGVSLFNLLTGLTGRKQLRQEMRIKEILDLSCKDATETNVPTFRHSTRIRDVLNRVLRHEDNDFLIVDENGLYVGVASQRDVLNPPRLKLILVDHNESGQALGALEEAELIEILDHHRLGNPTTHIPIRFTVDIVGSTSTLVSERIEDAGLSAPTQLAGALLGGLLSDTLILTSPTTTERDKHAAERLARWAFVRGGPLVGETIESFGQQVLKAGSGLETRDPDEIVNSDLKIYEASGYDFAIAQVEVTDFMQLKDHLEALCTALEDLRSRNGLDFAMLMVTDVVENASRLVSVNSPPMLSELPYISQPDNTYLAAGVVSRKKQLLPTILGLLES